MATETARALSRFGRSSLQVAGQLGIRAVMQHLDTPEGSLFAIGDHWTLIYAPATTEHRLAHLLGHYALHRDIRREFITSRYGMLDTEADDFAKELLRLYTAHSATA